MVADSIEANIESASVNVVRGSEHIRQARSHQVITSPHYLMLSPVLCCTDHLTSRAKDIFVGLSVINMLKH